MSGQDVVQSGQELVTAPFVGSDIVPFKQGVVGSFEPNMVHLQQVNSEGPCRL